MHIYSENICSDQVFIVTVPPHASITLQPGDRMEEQLPSPERAGQGEKHRWQREPNKEQIVFTVHWKTIYPPLTYPHFVKYICIFYLITTIYMCSNNWYSKMYYKYKSDIVVYQIKFQ